MEIPIITDSITGEEIGGDKFMGITVTYGSTGMSDQDKLDHHRFMQEFTAANLKVVEQKDASGRVIAVHGVSSMKTSF